MSHVICPYCSRRFDSVAESKDHLAVQHKPMMGAIELPPLELTTISQRAHDTADTLLEAFYLQDQRESHLIRENIIEAEAVASEARDLMAKTYEREFPHLDSSQARDAGNTFMNALFLHDEIENWEFLQQLLPDDQLEGVLLTDTDKQYAKSPATDPRWDMVEDYLREVCHNTNIDEAYAAKQTQFWRLHGQINEYWEELAQDAHRLKLQAIIETAPQELVNTLARYFVAGVKLHDEWGHQYKDSDMDEISDLVAKYYQKIFELRTTPQSSVAPTSQDDRK